MSKVPGRLHAAGGVLFILCGIAHAIGQISPTPLDDASRALEGTMSTRAIRGTPFPSAAKSATCDVHVSLTGVVRLRR